MFKNIAAVFAFLAISISAFAALGPSDLLALDATQQTNADNLEGIIDSALQSAFDPTVNLYVIRPATSLDDDAIVRFDVLSRFQQPSIGWADVDIYEESATGFAWVFRK